jgi:hypothetical protein
MNMSIEDLNLLEATTSAPAAATGGGGGGGGAGAHATLSFK